MIAEGRPTGIYCLSALNATAPQQHSFINSATATGCAADASQQQQQPTHLQGDAGLRAGSNGDSWVLAVAGDLLVHWNGWMWDVWEVSTEVGGRGQVQ